MLLGIHHHDLCPITIFAARFQPALPRGFPEFAEACVLAGSSPHPAWREHAATVTAAITPAPSSARVVTRRGDASSRPAARSDGLGARARSRGGIWSDLQKSACFMNISSERDSKVLVLRRNRRKSKEITYLGSFLAHLHQTGFTPVESWGCLRSYGPPEHRLRLLVRGVGVTM